MDKGPEKESRGVKIRVWTQKAQNRVENEPKSIVLLSGHIRPRQGTEICNFGMPSPCALGYYYYYFFFHIFSIVSFFLFLQPVQFGKEIAPKMWRKMPVFWSRFSAISTLSSTPFRIFLVPGPKGPENSFRNPFATLGPRARAQISPVASKRFCKTIVMTHFFRSQPSTPRQAKLIGEIQMGAHKRGLKPQIFRDWNLFRAYRADWDRILRTSQPRGGRRHSPERAFLGPIGAFWAKPPFAKPPFGSPQIETLQMLTLQVFLLFCVPTRKYQHRG